MKLWNKEIGKVFLAPVAGVSDAAHRILCKEYGADVTYTEMISAKALCFGDKKTKELLEKHGEEGIVAVQIFGSEPEIMAKAAAMLKNDFDFIDINMGCPAPKIVKNGEGSALMKNPSLAGEVIKAVAKAADIPVTVKIRRGFAQENCTEIARIAEKSGAAAVCVHGRFREQMYSGKSSREAIKRVVDAVKIPVIGNGDILNGADAKSLMDEVGCEGVCIARGSFGNPFIFREIKEYMEEGSVKTKPSDRERIETAVRHINMLAGFRGEKIGVLNARKHAAWYLKGIRGSSVLKNEIFTSNTLTEMEKVLRSVL